MPTKKRHITRFQAFAIHIGISLIIFSFLLILLLGFWYKPPFFDLEDGPKAIQIIIFVDLVLGPLLTLIVFKQGKPGLKFDLSLIALFQLSALIYGIWMVQMARPVVVILSYDALYIANYRSIRESDIPKAAKDKLIGLEPTYLYVNPPKDDPNFAAAAMKAFKDGRGLELLLEYSEPLSLSNKQQTSTIAIDIEKYIGKTKEWQAILQDFINAHDRSLNSMTFLPIQARYGKYFLVIDKEDGIIIDYLHVPYIDEIAVKARISPHGR